MEDPDPRLVEAAKAGDLRAFETIVRRYQADVWRLSFHLLHDEDLADETVQEAFVRVYRFLPKYRADSKFSTWLFSVVRNCALDEGRRAGRRKRTTDAVAAEPQPGGGDLTKRIEIAEALARLPLELREPIVLIDMLGTPYAEVAVILRVPVGTVKSRVHRARELLADELGPAEEEASGES